MGSSTLWLLAIGVNLVILVGGVGAYRLFRNDPSPVSSSAFGSPKVAVVDSASGLTVATSPTESGGKSARDTTAAAVVGLPTAHSEIATAGRTETTGEASAALAGPALNREFAGLFAYDSGAAASDVSATPRKA